MAPKLKGQILTSWFQGALQLIPEKFRAAAKFKRTTQPVTLDTTFTSTGGGIVESELAQTDINDRHETLITFDGEDPVVLESQQNYVDRTTGTVTETWSTTEPTADTGLLVSESTVENLGNGSFVKRTVKVSSHPVLYGAEYNDRLGKPIRFSEQYKTPPSDSSEIPDNTEVIIVNEDKALYRTRIPDEDDYDNYILGPIPSSVALYIPRVLLSVDVVWSKDSAEGAFTSDWDGVGSGTSWSLSGSESGDAQSAGSLIPKLTYTYRDYGGQRYPTNIYFCYMKLEDATATNILSRFSAQRWPVFKPQGHVFVLKGGKIAVQAKVSAQAGRSLSASTDTWDKTEGEGTSYDFNAYIETIDLPPMIHGNITVGGTTSDSLEVTADAEVGWTGTNFPTVEASAEATKTIAGSVSPTSLTATSPSSVPSSGTYLVDSSVQPAENGYAYVMVELLDASVLA